jgi:hypothetical protein
MERKRPTTWEDVVNWIRDYEARHRHEPQPDDEPSESDRVWHDAHPSEED